MLKKNLLMVVVLLLCSQWVKAELLDQIIAVVEDDVILDSELSRESFAVSQKIRASNMMMPPSFVLRKQVLERMILDKLQRQRAKRAGITISDDKLQIAISNIAAQNSLPLDQFRQELESQGMDFGKFQESIRHEIIVNQLRAREIGSRIKVTDREVAHYLETKGRVGQEQVKYRLGHILVSIPEAASATVIQKALQKAQQAVNDLREGADFEQLAMGISDGGNALNGGDLGWRTITQIPTLFVDVATKMARDEVSEPIRSPSGYHIIKMLELEGVAKHIVTKTRVRHILIKTNELINDEEAKKRLLTLKERIIDGDDFATLAKSHSDDKGSAIKGGNLEWVGPGALVPPFETAMNKLAINQLSQPVQTQFGWHLIQVLERQERDNSVEHKKNQVREEIRKRKIEEETELWLIRIRDEAFVEVNLDRL